MVDIMTIRADLDVLNHYHKQKSEFHFQQKSDNDFLMFLLDTAVRVISIVQHLAPVIEAVSAASADPQSDIVSDGDSSVNNPIANNLMEVDCVVEDQQLSLEIPSVPLPPPPVKTTDPQPCQITPSFSQNISPEQLNTITELEKEIQSVTETLTAAESYPPITDTYSSRVSLSESIRPSVEPSYSEPPSSATIIDTPSQSELIKIDIKPEVPVAEVVEIKEEVIETPHFSAETSSLSQILSSDHINQLMSSVVGSDNFNSSSSSTPPSYVTANKAANPLSMLHLQNNNAVLGSSLASSSEQMSLMNALFPNKEGILSGSDPGPSSGGDKKNLSGISPASNSNPTKWRIIPPERPKHASGKMGVVRGPKLYNSLGYIYTIKRLSKRGTYWWCCNRAKNVKCLAAVSQRDRQLNDFTPNSHQHNHPANHTALSKILWAESQNYVSDDVYFKPCQYPRHAESTFSTI